MSLLLLARAVHIVLGAFWVGTLIFNAAFLLPAMQEAGPNAAAVAAGLMRRRFLDIVPLAALLSVLAGLYLYWRVSGGFAPSYMRSTIGMTYGAGAAAALVALTLGLGIVRPSMLRAAADREGVLAAAQALRARAAAVSRVVAWLLGGTTLLMAIARYV